MFRQKKYKKKFFDLLSHIKMLTKDYKFGKHPSDEINKQQLSD